MERYTEYDEYGNADIIGVFSFENSWADSGEVLAWQPLPEPYKEV